MQLQSDQVYDFHLLQIDKDHTTYSVRATKTTTSCPSFHFGNNVIFEKMGGFVIFGYSSQNFEAIGRDRIMYLFKKSGRGMLWPAFINFWI